MAGNGNKCIQLAMYDTPNADQPETFGEIVERIGKEEASGPSTVLIVKKEQKKDGQPFNTAANPDNFAQWVMHDSSNPVVLQLRMTLGMINDHNTKEVSSAVEMLLAQLPEHPEKPKTFDELVARICRAVSGPSTSTAVQKKEQDEDVLADLMGGLSSEDAPMADSEAAAWGFDTGYEPDAENVFYYEDSTFRGSLYLVVEIIVYALNEAKRWRDMGVELLRLAVHKAKKLDVHPISRLHRDIVFVRKFLQHGRHGWPMMDIPHKFHNDVAPMLQEFATIVFQLSQKHEELRCLQEAFVDPSVRMLQVLRVLRRFRIAEEQKAGEAQQRMVEQEATWKRREEEMHPEKKVDGLMAMMWKSSLGGDRDGDMTMQG